MSSTRADRGTIARQERQERAPAGGHRKPSWRGSIPLAGQPRPSPSALPILAEGVPPFEQFWPPRQLVLEPTEGASSADGDAQPVHLVSVVERSDEEFHVAIPLPGTLALDPQPPLLVVVLLCFLGVLDRRLRPHLSGPKIDTPAAVDRVAFQNPRELLEVDRQRSQQRHRPGPPCRLESGREVCVALPTAVPQRRHASTRRLVDVFGRRMKHAEQTVADKLQGVLGPRLPLQDADEGSGVPAVDRASQLGPFLPVVHTHIVLAAAGFLET